MATEEEEVKGKAKAKAKAKAKDSKRQKKEKKEKKDRRRSESAGVHKTKKDKKEKDKLKAKVAEALNNQLQADAAVSAEAEDDDHHPGSDFEDIKNRETKKQLVYFAVPLADAKGHKKVYRTIKKARRAGALQRGVKEVNKALRKTPLKTPTLAHQVPGICIIAGDISPDEVIMHLPIYCEEHNVPYLFVKSRLELGAAAKTKRPTSAVFIQEKGREGKAPPVKADDDDDDDDDDGGGDSYAEAYKELLKLAQKAMAKQLKDLMVG